MSNTNALNPSKLFDVNGWVCVVTGGGTGIGLMIAQTLSAGGAKVYIAGRREEVLEKSAEEHGKPAAGEIIPIKMDVTRDFLSFLPDRDSIKEAVKEISAKEKCVHLLVNNSGVATDGKSDITKFSESAEAASQAIMETSINAWHNIYSTNVFSYFYTSGAFLPLLNAASKTEYGHSGCIINISSMSGITQNTQGGQFAYNSSKAATIHLTKLMAFEFKRDAIKVRVNSIAPGYFPSEMTRNESDSTNKSQMRTEDLNDYVPAKRPGNDKDMAQAVLSLACNQYINGTILPVEGGWLLANGLFDESKQ